MRRSSRVVCLALLAAASVSWPAERPSLEGYRALLEVYRTHDPATTTEGRDVPLEVSRWDPAEARRLAAEVGPDSLRAAALLHTEVAALELQERRYERAATQRGIAWRLVQRLPESPANAAFERQWLLGVGALLRADGSLAGALALGRRGIERFPGDPAPLLATAAVSEALTTLCFMADGTPLWNRGCVTSLTSLESTLRVAGELGGPSPLPKRRRLERQTEAHVRRLLAVDPQSTEVHLRLGRVLARLGEDEPGRRELQWVLAHATDQRHVALAHLFLGQIASRASDRAAAVAHARSALEVAPRAQSARLALAASLLSRGERDAAARTLAVPARPGAARADAPEDVWQEFLLGSMESYVRSRNALYAEVRRP